MSARPPDPGDDRRGAASGSEPGQRQGQGESRNLTTDCKAARERFRRAKLHLTHAAAACLAGETFASDWASAALVEISIARAELALLEEDAPC